MAELFQTTVPNVSMHLRNIFVEGELRPEHPDVARDLNNLAQLLQATNRLAEAEPLVRRMVEIFLKFTRATSHPHPHFQDAVNNYSGLLGAMGKSQGEIDSVIQGLLQQYGVSRG